jgi:hypothetical protein
MISIDAIRRLPLLLPTMEAMLQGEMYEVEMNGAKMIVSHVYMVDRGPLYDCSFSGNQSQIELMRDWLSQEFGEPVMESRPAGVQHYFFRSDSKEITKTLVHEVLGERRIAYHYNRYKLSEDDKLIASDILANWAAMVGNLPAKLQYALKRCTDLPRERSERILFALLDINKEFYRRQQLPRPG